MEAEQELLVEDSAESVFVYKRQPTDRPWGVTYAVFLAFAIIGGIYTATHRNPEYWRIDPTYLDDPRNCPLDRSNLLDAHQGDFNISDFMRHASSWLLVSAAGSLVVGAAFVQAFKKAPGFLTRATIAMQVATPLAMGVGGLAAGQWGAGAMGMVLAALGALVFYLWRNEIALCARLLGLSAEGLAENPGLILFVILAQVANAIIVVGLLTFTLFAYEHGYLLPNPARGERPECVDDTGQHVQCCVWVPSNWAQAYMGVTIVTTLWTVFLFSQARTFVVAGTIAQWYYSSPTDRERKGTTTRMVKYAFGPNFGTLAFGAAVLTVVQMARAAVDSARQSAHEGGNLLLSLLSCIVECIYALVEFLTKFATIMSAITGLPLLVAGRQVTDLLIRNLLKTVGVWWFPPMVVQFAALCLSAAWGLLLYTITRFTWSHHDYAKQEAALLGSLAFVMALIVLSFFASLLLDVVDALYVCYAIDRDRQLRVRAEVHEVFSMLPVGAVVEQPGGEFAYGAPAPDAPGSRVNYVPPAQADRYPQAP